MTDGNNIGNNVDTTGAVMLHLLEEIKFLRNEVQTLKTSGIARAQGGSAPVATAKVQRSTGTPMICSETGHIYKSKAQGAKAVAHEFGYTEANPPRNKAGEPAWNFIIYYITPLPGGKYRLIEYTGSKNPGETDTDWLIEWFIKNEKVYLESLKGSDRDASSIYLNETEEDDEIPDVEMLKPGAPTIVPAKVEAETPKVETLSEVKPAQPQPQKANPQNQQQRQPQNAGNKR